MKVSCHIDGHIKKSDEVYAEAQVLLRDMAKKLVNKFKDEDFTLLHLPDNRTYLVMEFNKI